MGVGRFFCKKTTASLFAILTLASRHGHMCVETLPGVPVIPGHSLEPLDALADHCTERWGLRKQGEENQTR